VNPRFHGSTEEVVAPVASARTPDQLPPLLAVGDFRLTDAEMAELTEASA
jgi:aryl-alcohol dehydrogenase-like predicted oxidoreductase